MTFALGLLQEATKPSLSWNYIVLGVLIVVAVILGIVVINKRKKEE